MEFAEAVTLNETDRLNTVRAAIIEQMGGEALSDTAAVAALFNAIDRVADSTGIPLEPEKAELSAGMREQLGINQFGVIDEAAAAE